ncbi:MAG: ComEC/Rec2 family competence protein [Alphaproteobacteria bacterium]|nr:ComEC/Rec2 family competence protein [Alphaproteobacteria bacterium]
MKKVLQNTVMFSVVLMLFILSVGVGFLGTMWAYGIGVFLIIGGMYCMYKNNSYSPWAFWVCLAIVVLGIWYGMHTQKEVKDTRAAITSMYAENVVVEGIVTTDTRVHAQRISYTIQVDTISTEEHLINTMNLPRTVSIFVYDNSYTKCPAGSRITAEGSFSPIEDFLTSKGRIFPYQYYALKDDVYGKLSLTIVDCREPLVPNIFSLVRNYFSTIAYRMYSDEEAGLLRGLLLGSKDGLDRSIQDIFITVGLIHIVVLSGYNISLVAVHARSLFSFFGGKHAYRVGIIGAFIFVWLFVFLSGQSITALRAGSMVGIALLAELWYRKYLGLRILLLVATVFVLYNPLILLYDVSFHLSFIATASLLLFVEWWEKIFSFVPTRFGLRSICASMCAVQIGTLPYIFYAIGSFSIVGFIANVLVLPVIPIAMFLGFVSLVGYSMFAMLGQAISFVGMLPLAYVLTMSKLLANVPFASISTISISASLCVIFYTSVVWYSIARW